MLEENNKYIENIETEESGIEIEEATKNIVAPLSLDDQQKQIAADIVKAETREELQRNFDLFDITQSKKNALRIIKLSNLMDRIDNTTIERFEKRPDEIPNKELLEYMQVVSAQIDKANERVKVLGDKPSIKQTNNTDVTININNNDLSRDSKEKVMDFIKSFLNQVEKNNSVIDAEVISPEETADPNENIVYNTDTELLNEETESGE